MLLFIFLLNSCNRTSDVMFWNPSLQEHFCSFVQSAKSSESHEVFFQVILGQNTSGVKVDFIATNAYLNSPLYFYDPVSFTFLGQCEIDSSYVSVFGCAGEQFSQIINEKTLSKNLRGFDNQYDCVRPVIERWQIWKGGAVTPVSISKGLDPSYYHLVEDSIAQPSVKMVLYDFPSIYEIITSETIVRGVWKESTFQQTELVPKELYRYSITKNEMLKCDVSSIYTIVNRNIAELLSISRLRKEGHYLIPTDGDTSNTIIWEKD